MPVDHVCILTPDLTTIIMKCPECPEIDLIMSERQGVEIDYCPTCRGVWLDRGELDKIIERSTASPQPQAAPSHRSQESGHSSHSSQDDHYDKHDKLGQTRKKSWIAELFD